MDFRHESSHSSVKALFQEKKYNSILACNTFGNLGKMQIHLVGASDRDQLDRVVKTVAAGPKNLDIIQADLLI